jgi:VWFA-related protein
MIQGKPQRALVGKRRATILFLFSMGACFLFAAQQQPQSDSAAPRAQGSGQEAQQPPRAQPGNGNSEISTRSTDTTIKVRVNLVLVRVVVKDASGKLVPDLTKEDFQILDNGKEQRISTFSMETAEAHAKPAATAAPGATEPRPEAQTDAGANPLNATVMPQRFLALVFDDLHMNVAEAMAVHAASEKLFTALTPTDRVAIYATSGEVNQEFTGDAETLRKTLKAIIPHRRRGEGEYECPNISYYQADLIANKHDQEAMTVALLDAKNNYCPMSPSDINANAYRILQAGDQSTRSGFQNLENAIRHMSNMPGQRVLVYVSPGFILGDTVMPENSELIDRAARTGVVINTIDARALFTADMLPDIAAPSRQMPDKNDAVDYQRLENTYQMQSQFASGAVLGAIAAGTGGTFFHNRNDLDVAMSQALAAPSVSYVLGFSPQNLKVDGKYHKLKVMVMRPQKYQVQARNGYYAPKVVADPQEAVKQEVREALFSQDEILDVPMDLKTQFFKGDAVSAQLTVFTHLDLKGIHFRKADGRSYNDMVLATGVFDDNGQFVDGQMREIALKLTDSTVERLNQTGFTIKIAFTVKPGTYLVRSVVHGSEGGQMTARNTTTVIPN